MIEWVTAALAGYVAHQTSAWFDRHFSGGLGQVARYAFGVLLVYPLARWMYRRASENDARFDSAFWGAFCPFGAGVLIGWIVDRARDGR